MPKYQVTITYSVTVDDAKDKTHAEFCALYDIGTDPYDYASIQIKEIDISECDWLRVPTCIIDDNTNSDVTTDYIETLKSFKDYLEEFNCDICLVDSEKKESFIHNLLENNKTYYIQGINVYDTEDDTAFFDNNDNELTYTNWDENQPYYKMFNNIIINENKKWQTASGTIDKHGYIAEYKIKRLSNYFKNPRIYYEILSSKEDE